MRGLIHDSPSPSLYAPTPLETDVLILIYHYISPKPHNYYTDGDINKSLSGS